ncbi:MAG: hypothetical protein ACXWW7_16460 [Nocardioides sp.]
MSSAIGVVSAKVDDWSSKLEAVGAGDPGDATDAVDGMADDLADGGGAKQQAGVRGVQAGLEGKNPVWAAIKGAWAGGSTLVRAAVVAAGVALLLLLLLSPVLLLAFLLTALVVAAVTKARSAKK